MSQLIVHMGQHKTGSTYVQETANKNHGFLRECGVYYQPVAGYPAHNAVAWPFLRGDPTPLKRMIEEGLEAGCPRILFSAEDLTALLIRPDLREGLEEVARGMGLSTSYHMCLRSPVEIFWSQYAEISKVYFISPLFLFAEVMRKGCYVYANVDPADVGNRPPLWFICFDNRKYVGSFARQVENRLFLYDFAEASPFPGWRLFHWLGVPADRLAEAESWARNQRLPEEGVVGNYVRRVQETLPPESGDETLAADIVTHSLIGERMRQRLTAALDSRFAGQNEQLLEKYGWAWRERPE